MAGKFSELRSRMSPEAQARAAARAEAMWVDMQLQAVRQARQMTQSDVGTAMGIEQAAISKLERRNDMHVSTLREYIRALGGELKLVASFPDGDVTLNPMLSEPGCAADPGFLDLHQPSLKPPGQP